MSSKPYTTFKAQFKFADGMKELTVVKLNVPLSADKFAAVRADMENAGAFYSRKNGVHGFVFKTDPDWRVIDAIVSKYV